MLKDVYHRVTYMEKCHMTQIAITHSKEWWKHDMKYTIAISKDKINLVYYTNYCS